MSIVLVCASLSCGAQTNYVKNGDFERYDTCPYEIDQLKFATFWCAPIDSNWTYTGEYYNACANVIPDRVCHVPDNTGFYQFAHSGQGIIGLHLYYDKTLPRPPLELPFNFRDYAQVRLYQTLKAGKSYCVTIWVNKTEAFCYAHDKIGAYLDDGSVNTATDSAGKEITTVTPQVYTNAIVRDTQNWVKIEGSFVASGNESMITIGNFFPNNMVDTTSEDCVPGGLPRYSYYLFDDISVVASDARANAGPDRWVELGKKTAIGPVEDTTARGMDCKWFHEGALVDSGNVIQVAANTTVYAVDTYVVVQTVCGTVTSDTMLLRTVGLDIVEKDMHPSFSVRPNPNHGSFVVAAPYSKERVVNATVCDVLGRVVYRQQLDFFHGESSLQLPAADGVYVLVLTDTSGVIWRERIVVN